MMSSRSVALLFVLATAAVANADDVDPVDSPHWRLEGALGMRMGSFFADGKDTGIDVPGYVLLGARHGRWFLAAEHDLMTVVYPVPAQPSLVARGGVPETGDGRGLMHRLGANARWAFGHVNDDSDGLFADLYAEAGAGVEAWDWDAGGVWWRPDFSFGLGTELLHFGQSHGGMTFGLRFTLAPRDNVATSSQCGGPCTYPTPPTGIDRSVMFDMGLVFGR